MAALVFIGALLGARLLVQESEQQRLALRRVQAQEIANDHAESLHRQIERTLSIASAFAAQVRQGHGHIADFAASARELLPFYPSASAVHLAPDGVVSEVYPLEGNAAVLGLNLLEYSPRTREALRARETGTLTLSGPYELVQGGLGAVGRLPVFLPDAIGEPRFWGFVSVVMRLPEAIEAARLAQLRGYGYEYKLGRTHPDTGKLQIIAQSSERPLVAPVLQDLSLPNSTWTLSVSPIAGWGDPAGYRLKLALGIVLSLLLAILVLLLARARRHEARLSRLVEEQTEILRAREAALLRAEELARVGTWDYDFATDRVTLSAVAARLLGRPPHPTTGLEVILEQVHPLDRDAVRAAWAAASAGAPLEVEHRCLVDGRIRWLRHTAVIEREGGRPGRAHATLEDVTERKQAEEARQRSEQRIRDILDRAPEGVWSIDLGGRTLFANPKMAEILGCRPDQLAERSVFDFIDPADRKIVERHLADRARGITDQFEFRFKRLDSSMVWTLVTTDPTHDEQGQLTGALAVISDISARKQAEAALERERLLLEQAERLAGIVSWEWEIATDRLEFSRGGHAAILRFGEAPPRTMTEAMDYVHPDDVESVREALSAAAAGTRPCNMRHRMIDPVSQQIHLVHTVAELIQDPRGQPEHVVGMIQDITAQDAAETDLRIAAIAFESQEGMLVTDANERILRVNKAFLELSGYSAEEIIGQTPRILASGRHDTAFFARMWGEVYRVGYWEGEVWNRRKGGEIVPLWLNITAVQDANGWVTHYVGNLNDISERKAQEERIHALAFHDPLTGLPNRRLLLDRLERAIATAARSGRWGALIFIDLDNFKRLNDTRGHQVGDLLLQAVAERLTATVRGSDSVARLGGDEFVVLLQDLGDTETQATMAAREVAEKILAALATPYELSGLEHFSTPSLGVSLFAGGTQAAADVLRHADVAMYQAKSAGRNQLRFFDPVMQEILEQRAALEADLHRAIAQHQLVLHYQPQVDLQGRVTGAEALLRWRHPERGLLHPRDFMGFAETLALTVPIGRWVLDRACARLVDWATRPETASLILAVNISPAHFRRGDFVEDVRAAMHAHGVDPTRLRLELIEGALLDDPVDTLTKMTALKSIGLGFTLDNFGSGYCSLSNLKRLPLDQLKIAPAFVREVLVDTNGDAIAEPFVALAKGLGLALMAEGVETTAQRDYLSRHGCQVFQGYLFGHPDVAEHFVETITSP